MYPNSFETTPGHEKVKLHVATYDFVKANAKKHNACQVINNVILYPMHADLVFNYIAILYKAYNRSRLHDI